MSFWAYLYQLRASFRKFFNTKKNIAKKNERTQEELEIKEEINYYLLQQCKKTTKAAQYISSLTHWPIAKPKTKQQQHSLIYLDVKRSTLASLEQRNKRRNIIANTTKIRPIVKRASTVKKLPNA
jgi:hypothetical protein